MWSGSSSQAAAYSSSAGPPSTATTTMMPRTMSGSMPRRSAMPAATPPIQPGCASEADGCASRRRSGCPWRRAGLLWRGPGRLAVVWSQLACFDAGSPDVIRLPSGVPLIRTLRAAPEAGAERCLDSPGDHRRVLLSCAAPRCRARRRLRRPRRAPRLARRPGAAVVVLVLAFLGGAGVLLYLWLWALVPARAGRDGCAGRPCIAASGRPILTGVAGLAALVVAAASPGAGTTSSSWVLRDHVVAGAAVAWSLGLRPARPRPVAPVRRDRCAPLPPRCCS